MNTIPSARLLLAIFAACSPVAHGQQETKTQAAAVGPVPIKKAADLKFKHESFVFARVLYSGKYSRGRRGGGGWATDYPDADLNFTARFQKETGLKCDPSGKVTEITDAGLKPFPFIYLVEGGQLHLSDAEVEVLRRYLLGGGFLMADDFWGEAEWDAFRAEMMRVFPGREPVEIPIDHPVFHCFYDIKEKPQIPNVMLGTSSQFNGVTWEREDGKVPHYRGLFDDKGRLMAIFCHNTDLGDGWEREGENAYYFREFSLKKAYPLGINIVVYALTH